MFASLLVHFSFDVLIAISVMELYEGETFPVAKRYYTSAEAYRFIESSPRSMNKNFPSAAAGGWFSRCKRMRRKTYLDTFNNDTPIISVEKLAHWMNLHQTTYLLNFDL
ncbi:hypothetical protein AB6A40_003315 [Gnathostoma spinigerum]|uniref:Uncharacterized protein n=1 Tax=Gnathostoma spinigerum TaxID=75299 RepID=A0ABD6EBP5_9BILA